MYSMCHNSCWRMSQFGKVIQLWGVMPVTNAFGTPKLYCGSFDRFRYAPVLISSCAQFLQCSGALFLPLCF